MLTDISEIVLVGLPICQGVAIGKPFWLRQNEGEVPDYPIQPHEVDSEIERYRSAITSAKQELFALHLKLKEEKVQEGAAILESHLHMLDDPLLTTQIEHGIQTTLKNAASVFYASLQCYQKRFNSIKDPFFRERFKDLQDISSRILERLRTSSRFSFQDIPSNSVLIAQNLSAGDAAEANAFSVLAFVSAVGGTASHAAIVAKACGIPYVSNIAIDAVDIPLIDTIIVNGTTGEVILNPTAETLAKHESYRPKPDDVLLLNDCQLLNPETYDGYQVQVSANIDTGSELHLLHTYGGDGVGLFRSEFVFLSKEQFPSEEEQFQIYKSIVERMQGLPIVIRTFDLGGDKFLRQSNQPKENNPFLGCRAIRFLLKERELFKTQLRAILRTSAFGEVSIMFPMISCLSELLEAKALLKEVERELESFSYPLRPVRIGCMIEVPSAAVISDLLARECDFLSIGTNDLVQYALAVDRDNHSLQGLYSPTDPSVLRLIKLVVAEANDEGIPVAVCGEVAADPLFTPLLIGLGVHELSVASRYLPVVKKRIRSMSIIEAHHLAEAALSLGTSQEVSALLQDFAQIS